MTWLTALPSERKESFCCYAFIEFLQCVFCSHRKVWIKEWTHVDIRYLALRNSILSINTDVNNGTVSISCWHFTLTNCRTLRKKWKYFFRRCFFMRQTISPHSTPNGFFYTSQNLRATWPVAARVFSQWAWGRGSERRWDPGYEVASKNRINFELKQWHFVLYMVCSLDCKTVFLCVSFCLFLDTAATWW